jgi:hypothetical protein
MSRKSSKDENPPGAGRERLPRSASVYTSKRATQLEPPECEDFVCGVAVAARAAARRVKAFYEEQGVGR